MASRPTRLGLPVRLHVVTVSKVKSVGAS